MPTSPPNERRKDADLSPSQTNATQNSDASQKFDNLQQIARAQQGVEHELTRWQAIKSYPKAFAWMILMVWCMILVGYENQASGIVVSIPQFRKDFGHSYGDGSDYVLDTNWQSALSGGPTGTLAIFSVVGSWFADKFGRRWTLFVAVLVTIPFVAIEYASTTIDVFFSGKLLNACSLGVIISVAPSYASEIAPLALRGFVAAACSLSLCIGPFVCYLINNTTASYTTRWAYRAVFIPQWIFSITCLIPLIFLPESPYYLLLRDNNEKALKSLNSMFGPVQAERQFALMKETVEESTRISASVTYLDCFRKSDLRRTLLVIFAFIAQPLSGVSFISNYSTYYYELAGFSTERSYQLSCGAQALSVSGVIASWFIIDRFGRRPLLLFGMIALTILNFVVAGAGINTSNTAGVTTASAFIAMYNFFYNVAIGPLPYIFGSEVSSVSLRAKTMALGLISDNAMQCMWSFVLPYMFNPDRANMGSNIMWIFGGLAAFTVVVFYLYQPETAHRSFEEIDEMFATKVPARHWKVYVTKTQRLMQEVYTQVKDIKVEHVENV